MQADGGGGPAWQQLLQEESKYLSGPEVEHELQKQQATESGVFPEG